MSCDCVNCRLSKEEQLELVTLVFFFLRRLIQGDREGTVAFERKHRDRLRLGFKLVAWKVLSAHLVTTQNLDEVMPAVQAALNSFAEGEVEMGLRKTPNYLRVQIFPEELLDLVESFLQERVTPTPPPKDPSTLN